MSIDDSGLDGKVLPQNITIDISANHPLIKLVNTISWNDLFEIALPDIKAKGDKLFIISKVHKIITGLVKEMVPYIDGLGQSATLTKKSNYFVS